MIARKVYEGSDGEITKAYYAELQQRGLIGKIAMNLFRAQKCSERAKVYRGGIRGQGSYRGMAYERKGYSIDQLCLALQNYILSYRSDIGFGWKRDPKTILGGDEAWVLYVDLPQGQVSFHSAVRYAGPDYAGDWDGQRASVERILAFCDAVMSAQPIQVMEPLQSEPQNEPGELCSCAKQMYRNNGDGSTDHKMQGNPRCRKCRGRGFCRICPTCAGAGIHDSKICWQCAGAGSIPA